MGTDPTSILKLAGMLGLGFLFVGVCSLFVGVHKARRDFRQKGFLRPPAGFALIRFLLFKQYEYFENPGIRLFFGASHFCMLGVFIVIGAMLVLVGSEMFFQGG